MLIEQTVDKLNQMKLFGMAQALKERLSRPDHSDLSSSELMGLIIDDEWTDRQNRKMTSRLKTAHFKEKSACVENIDYKRSRGLKKNLIVELSNNRWIKAHQNIILTGSSGAGKSYIAQALGHQACQDGFTVAYIRVPKLLIELIHTRAAGTYSRYLKKLAKTELILLDDFGISALEHTDKTDLLEIIEDRYSTASTIITSQMPVSSWHEYLGGGMVGDAICDRIIHNAHRIELKTDESMRKKKEDLIPKEDSGINNT